MLMNRKIKPLDTLEARLKATAVSTDFNIAEDLESLVQTYGILKSKDYRKKLEAVLEKYKTSELTAIRNSVIKESEKGNMQAVRLYAEYFKPSEAVHTDDGLAEVIRQSSGEVFKNEQ